MGLFDKHHYHPSLSSRNCWCPQHRHQPVETWRIRSQAVDGNVWCFSSIMEVGGGSRDLQEIHRRGSSTWGFVPVFFWKSGHRSLIWSKLTSTTPWKRFWTFQCFFFFESPPCGKIGCLDQQAESTGGWTEMSCSEKKSFVRINLRLKDGTNKHEINLYHNFIWVFPKIWAPQNGWFLYGKPLKWMILGVPLFLETSTSFEPFLLGGQKTNSPQTKMTSKAGEPLTAQGKMALTLQSKLLLA